LSLGSSSQVTLTGSSSIVIGANFGTPFPSSCRGAYDTNAVNHDGEFGSGWYTLTLGTSGEQTQVFCEMPPIPVSCKDVYEGIFTNVDGLRETGTFLIQPTIALEPYEVYCDLDSAGGGWTLVANVRGNGGWLPDTGSGANALNASFSFNVEGYDPTWSSDVSYYLDYSGISHTSLMFMTKDREYYCVLGADNVRQATNSSGVNSIIVYSYSANIVPAVLVASQSTDILNLASDPASPFIGCAAPNGTYANNIGQLLWAEADAPYFEFKNAHGGIGLFVK
jgi:hypothetical protein